MNELLVRTERLQIFITEKEKKHPASTQVVFANKILQPLFKTKCKLAKLRGTTGNETLPRALFTSSLTLFAVHSQTIVRELN